MSVPYADHWVPLAVLVASLAGSAHCVSMCGGLVVATAKTRASWWAYHLGRLLGYLTLGMVAGFLGENILGGTSQVSWLSVIAAFVLGVGFIVAATRIWFGKMPHFSVIPASVLTRIFRHTQGNAWATGVLTAFLPCGWLHTFVLGAVATKSPMNGAAFLFIFWLGTLPALAATPWLVQKAFRPLLSRAPRVAAVCLLIAGFASIGGKVVPLISAGGGDAGSCHHNSK